MKPWLFAAVAMAGVAGLLAQAPTPPASAQKSPAAPVAKSADPKAAAKSGTQAKAPGKQEEPEPKVEGLAIARPGGGYLGLRRVDNRFVIAFYDKDKKPAPADVHRATLRWTVRYQVNDERAILSRSSDGNTLTGPTIIRPPYTFRVFMSLFVEGKPEAVESHSFDYRGE